MRVQINGAPVQRSGAGFTIVPTGNCFENLTFAIIDATGQTVPNPPTVTNVKGENAPTVPLSVAPSQSGGSPSSRVSCAGTFSFTITGKAPFSATASDPTVTLSNGGTVAASPGVLSVSTFTPGSTVTITVGDASSPQNIKSETIYCQ
jgi:hypothetical protein